jgi:hypothetical protein
LSAVTAPWARAPCSCFMALVKDQHEQSSERGGVRERFVVLVDQETGPRRTSHAPSGSADDIGTVNDSWAGA